MTRLPEPGKRDSGLSTPPLLSKHTRTTSIRTLGEPAPQRSVSGAEMVLDELSNETAGPVSGRRVAYVAGLVVADKYELLRPLGAGGMGEVLGGPPLESRYRRRDQVHR